MDVSEREVAAVGAPANNKMQLQLGWILGSRTVALSMHVGRLLIPRARCSWFMHCNTFKPYVS